MSPPLDPRLLRRAGAARWAIAATTLLSIAVTAVVVAIALTLARALGPLVTGEARVADVAGEIGLVAALFGLRALLQIGVDRIGHMGATAVIAQLRAQVLAHVARLGPRWAAEHGASTGTLLTRGLDALGPYFTAYVPQLLLSAILTPALLVIMATQDVLAAVTLVVAIPLIPVFMWLIGVLTSRYAAERLAALTRLGRQLLDLVAGLPTLRAFGRALGPAQRVRTLAERARVTTMATLRVAFLSGAVLELISTIAVAMVAVGVGLRLVSGDLDLVTALAVLVMAPEVLFPLRQVGVQFHNAADGVAAAEEALGILGEPAPAEGGTALGVVDRIRLDGVSVRAGERDRWAPAGLSADVVPGRITVLAGESGSGKSTAMNVLLGLIRPDRGGVGVHTANGWVDLADADLDTWWSQLTWVPQRPTFEPGTLAEIVGPDSPAISRDEAAAAAGLGDVVASLSAGWDTRIGQGGVGLSVGQRQRLALTRSLLADARFVVLDEPTAHLDAASEDVVISAVRAAARAGKGVLIIAHRPSVMQIADELVTVEAAEAVTA